MALDDRAAHHRDPQLGRRAIARAMLTAPSGAQAIEIVSAVVPFGAAGAVGQVRHILLILLKYL